MQQKLLRILLVEDEEADIVHFQRVSRKVGLDAEIVVARNGDQALTELRSGRLVGHRCIIVTDLNMPGLTGHELIEELRGDGRLASHVVFVISTSDLADDIEKAYSRQVAGYIVKDARGQRIEAGIAMLERYAKAVAL